jgi:multicomponent Na+:H+ antiporter subunit F
MSVEFDLGSGPLRWAIVLTFVMLIASMGMAFVRMARGPSLADRVVALDLLAILTVAFAALFAIASGQAAFLDVAIALALVAFLGTVAFARYAERRPPGREKDGRVSPAEASDRQAPGRAARPRSAAARKARTARGRGGR